MQFRGPGDGCGDGERIPPSRGEGGCCRGVLRGALQLRFGLAIRTIIGSLKRSLDPLKTPAGQRYKHGEE